jgi:hypothetical protein
VNIRDFAVELFLAPTALSLSLEFSPGLTALSMRLEPFLGERAAA